MPHCLSVACVVLRVQSWCDGCFDIVLCVAQFLARSESLLHHIFVVAYDMLVLLRGSSETFRTDLAAVRIVFCVNGDHVPLEPRSVPGAVVAVLALVDSPFFLSFANDDSHTAG